MTSDCRGRCVRRSGAGAECIAHAIADKYRIERELGAGGMATVYLTEDVRHQRKVALKIVHPELAAVLGNDRFLAEIRTTATLQHPNILTLFDARSLPNASKSCHWHRWT